jgi:hypothetical protein
MTAHLPYERCLHVEALHRMMVRRAQAIEAVIAAARDLAQQLGAA